MLFPYKIDDQVELRLTTEDDTEVVFQLIDQNQEHLDRWLRWSATIQTLDDVRSFIKRYTEKYAADDGFHTGIWFGDALAGGLACRYINRESHKSEIGYWLGAIYVGRDW